MNYRSLPVNPWNPPSDPPNWIRTKGDLPCSGRHSSGDSAEKQMLISWHRELKILMKLTLDPGPLGRGWCCKSSGQAFDNSSVVLGNKYNSTILSIIANFAIWDPAGLFQKKNVAFVGLQSRKSWFYRRPLAHRVGLILASQGLAQSRPFHARREQHSLTWVRSAKYTATQCNANPNSLKMSQANCLQPPSGSFCRRDPVKVSPHQPQLSRQVSPQWIVHSLKCSIWSLYNLVGAFNPSEKY